MATELRKTGIDVLGDAAWGTHFCQFYQTREDLLDILVPYIRAGLENNEFCMWVTSAPLGKDEATKALRSAVPDLDGYLGTGQIEILPHTEWYLRNGAFDAQRVLKGWVDKLNGALAAGFEGLRLTGNTHWLEEADWASFAEYEQQINDVIGKYRMLAMCSYGLDKCGAAEILEVVSSHQFALIRQAGKWAIIESPERKRAAEAFHKSEETHRTLLENLPQKIFLKDSNSVYISCNSNYAQDMGIAPEDIAGKTDHDFYPTELADKYRADDRQVMASGQALEIEEAYVRDGQEFTVQTVKTPVTDSAGNVMGVLGIFWDITERKTAQEQTIRQAAVLQAINDVFREAMICQTEEEMGKTCLAVAENLTGSKFGFICEVNPSGRLDTIAISNPGWDACRMPGSREILMQNDLPVQGIRGKVIQDGVAMIFNEPASHPDWIAPPKGHPTITSFLGVPLKHQGKTIGMIALGNKEGGYAPADQEAVESLAVAIVEALRTKRAEEELSKHRDHLEELVEERTDELRKTVNLMAGREVRMAQLKEAIKKLREQLDSAGMKPVADDPLIEGRSEKREG